MTPVVAREADSSTTSQATAGGPLVHGALAGALATLLFMVVHDQLIMPIWDMAVPMLISGALCGLCIAWSHVRISTGQSATSWLALNGAYLMTLILLGIVSLVGFEPAWTFAELNADDPPLGDLFGAALPLMGTFTIVAATLVWLGFGRTRSAILPILIAEACLVVLLGHNVAIIGLVDLTTEGWSLVRLMFGLVILLGVTNAFLYLAVRRAASLAVASRETSNAE